MFWRCFERSNGFKKGVITVKEVRPMRAQIFKSSFLIFTQFVIDAKCALKIGVFCEVEGVDFALLVKMASSSYA